MQRLLTYMFPFHYHVLLLLLLLVVVVVVVLFHRHLYNTPLEGDYGIKTSLNIDAVILQTAQTQMHCR